MPNNANHTTKTLPITEVRNANRNCSSKTTKLKFADEKVFPRFRILIPFTNFKTNVSSMFFSIFSRKSHNLCWYWIKKLEREIQRAVTKWRILEFSLLIQFSKLTLSPYQKFPYRSVSEWKMNASLRIPTTVYAHEIRIEDKFECYPSFARKRKIKSEENLFLVID